MKRTLILLAACTMVASANAQVYVKPHYDKNGSYTEGHIRSAPNSTTLDNYSTKGNTNPYTGQQGTQQPSYNSRRDDIYSPPQPRNNPLNSRDSLNR